MFGYEPLTTVTAIVALGSLVVALMLLFQKNVVGLIGPLFIGAAAWAVGGLTTGQFVGVSQATVGALAALGTAVIGEAFAGLGLGLPLPVGVVVLLLVALFLLFRRSGGKRK